MLEIPIDNRGLVALVFNKEFFCIQTHDDEVSCNGFLFFGSAQTPIISLEATAVSQFEQVTSMIQSDLQIKDNLQGEMLRSSLKRLLVLSTRMAKRDMPEPSITNGHLNVIREFNVLVEQHFRTFHQVKDYANLLHKSPKTLSNLFPKFSDKSPLMVIYDRIILEAKRLLLYSDKSNDEIALELGYKDAGHFSKFFKNQVGESPTMFKKSRLLRQSA